MKKMVLSNLNYMDTFNAIAGAVIAFLTFIFGEHWLLFAVFLLLNIIDWITGWMKSRIAKKENSVKGWQGVLKKIGYWLMIMVAFALSAIFIELGNTLGIDLGVTTLLGWFVLASLLVNEARSIVENFVEAGFNVPNVLINGLEVANKIINKDTDAESEEVE
ncbi:holin [Erysipelatoclostridium sp. An15]|uniref:phage holin family protein n=1 Tax=Erysipelatoclostridium sp. An15 TaxID=1965566 RepID=UPI000B382F92|nr:phage holin family protein [Erysipelatoclostridium sp. An15]OUQ08306.1 holin [Erysipelatoclostridium sp. An15]